MTPRLDLFPALVVHGDEYLRNVRVYAIEGTNDGLNEIFVFEWNSLTAQPDLIRRDEWLTITQSRRRSRSWDVTVVSGEVWLIGRGGGCGCHAPLKSADIAGLVAAMLIV